MLSHVLYASFADSADQRTSDRRVLRLGAEVATPAGKGDIEVHNLSRTGMLVEVNAALPVGTAIEVELPGGARHRAEVVWADETLLGCRFAKPLSQATLSAALLRATPSAPAIAQPTTQDEAFAKLREHWDFEHEIVPATNRALPLGTRLWIIAGLGLTGWAVPAAAAWMFW